MARDFHRIPLSALIVNLAAVPLTGVIVPLGFLTLVWGLISPLAGKLLSAPLVRMAFMACALTIAIYPFGKKWTEGKLELTVLDVGQGDSLFVVSPGGKTLLIDGGGAFGGFPRSRRAQRCRSRRRNGVPLSMVSLTHAQQDHVGGLLAILEHFQVGRVWIGREVSSRALLRLEELPREQRIPIEHELRGKTIHWDGVEGDFL